MTEIDQALRLATGTEGLPPVDISPQAGIPAHLDTSVQFPDGAAGISFRRKAEVAEPPSADVQRELRSLLGSLKDLKPDYDAANTNTMRCHDALNAHNRNPIEPKGADQLEIVELAEQREAIAEHGKTQKRLENELEKFRKTARNCSERRTQLITDVIMKFTESSGSEEWKALARETRTEIENMYGPNTAWELSKYC